MDAIRRTIQLGERLVNHPTHRGGKRIADHLSVDCPVFYVDNVAEYWLAHRDSVSVRDVPIVAPMFPRIWLEYSLWMPAGALYPRSEAKRIDRALEINSEAVEGGGWLLRMIDWSLHQDPIYDSKFTRITGYKPPAPIDSPEFKLMLDADGRAVNPPSSPDPQNIDPVMNIDSVVEWLIFPCLMAIAFAHCKNVRHVEHQAQFKSGKGWRMPTPVRVRHYTLEIDSMKQVLRTEGRVGEVGLGKALHICRGHFATYDGAGLFGKHKGTFWREYHVRGKLERGVVLKDYDVKAPKS